jgi:hypothetical protein
LLFCDPLTENRHTLSFVGGHTRTSLPTGVNRGATDLFLGLPAKALPMPRRCRFDSCQCCSGNFTAAGSGLARSRRCRVAT